MANKFSFGEGASLNKPPLFCGNNYQLWCIRMKFFIESLDKEIWNVISNNAFMHMPKNNSASTKNERDHLDYITKNTIVSALDYDELLKVSECISAKEMWDTLEKCHKNPRSAWLEKEESSVESSSSETEMEVCLMAREESGSNQVSTSSSNKCDSYFQLLDAFQETHEEDKKLTLSNNQLKSENNWLKEKIKALKNDLNNSNADFENLELIYQNSSYKCDSSFCKNCQSLQKKV